VEALAAYVGELVRERYQLGREEMYATEESDNPSYRQRGSSLLEILTNELGSSDDTITDAVIDNLPDVSHADIADGDEPFYDSTASYERISDVEADEAAEEHEYWYENRFRYKCDDFRNKVQYERRFFKTKEPLDELFGGPEEYEQGSIRPIYMLKTAQRIFRARVLDGNFTEEILRGNPARELGAPPKSSARAGRMNADYIPAFYGAFSAQTAVAEMRPGIGDEVAIGEFILQRDVKVFDFTVFSRPPVSNELREIGDHTRYDFITQMEEEISRRVLPGDKHLQYISTQIVAEYLQEYFRCEAVIYKSAVVRDETSENRNVVFLPRADGFAGKDDAILKYDRLEVLSVEDVTYQLGVPF
jgi:hypothetical protein